MKPIASPASNWKIGKLPFASALRFSWGKIWARFVVFMLDERDAIDHQADALFCRRLARTDFLRSLIDTCNRCENFLIYRMRARTKPASREEWAEELNSARKTLSLRRAASGGSALPPCASIRILKT